MSVKLVFLGTGSGKPTPSRGVSSVALFREGDVYLFDCGEGTQIQLAKSSLKPGSIRAIFISHFHGDHVNGLPGLLGSLTLNQREEPLDVFGPVGLLAWFDTLKKLNIFWPGFEIRLHEIDEAGTVFEGDGFRFETDKLKHRITCWGYVMVEDDRPGRFDVDAATRLGVTPGRDFGKLQRGDSITLDNGDEIHPEQVMGEPRPGLRIAYCCDTMPCDGAERLAMNADVLIHESTYPAGDEKMARQRGHSTSGDAAKCAAKCNVDTLILTHLSQKHPRKDVFLEGARPIHQNVRAAHDLWEFEIGRKET